MAGNFHDEVLKLMSEEMLDKSITSSKDFLSEVASYQKIQKADACLEKALLNSVSMEDFEKLNIGAHLFPKMFRGLPRFYDRNDPANSSVKPHFKNFLSLQRQHIDKALMHLYQDVKVEKAQVTILTWVMNDGMGDFYASIEIAKLIKENMPQLDVHLITLLPKDISYELEDISWHPVRYQNKKDLKLALFDDSLIKLLKDSSYILQTPTYFPETPELMKMIGRKIDSLGEYGFIDSKAFNPKTGNRSLGLHFLEKGIPTLKPKKLQKEDLFQLEMRKKLFGRVRLNEKHIEKYLEKRRFNLAYLQSLKGTELYLNAILKKRGADTLDLDFVFPDGAPLIEFFEKKNPEEFFRQYGVKEVSVQFDGKEYQLEVQKKGKRVRFFAQEKLSNKDFQTLVLFTQDLVGIRGNRSFSEVVSYNKPYFFDAPYHSKNFLRDLSAVAGYYLKDYPTAKSFISLFFKNIRKKRSSELYVEEEFFQKSQDLSNKAKELFSDPNTAKGMRVLNKILVRYFSANPYLISMVKSAVLHHQIPAIKESEETLLLEFFNKEISFVSLINEISLIIIPYKM